MKLPVLQEAQLVRRYKRFLADVYLVDGTAVTAHCPNTGAMTGCAEPGSRVWLSRSDNPKRKYAHTLELVETPRGIVSVNTNRANRLVAEALTHGTIREIGGEDVQIAAEAKIPDGRGRFDFLVTRAGAKVWIEVKSVTLLVDDEDQSATKRAVGAFPDAVSARALKHVEALADRVQQGDRAMLLFCAQHCGIQRIRTAREIDPTYAEAVTRALQAGVEVVAYGCTTDLHEMRIDRALTFMS